MSDYGIGCVNSPLRKTFGSGCTLQLFPCAGRHRPPGDERKGCQPDAEHPGKPQERVTVRSRPQACKTGLPERRPSGARRLGETSSDAPELGCQAGAPCKGKVCPKGIRKSHRRFSGYPDDYLAPSLFVKRRCCGSRYALRESGAFEGRAGGRLGSAFSRMGDNRAEGKP